MTISLSNVASNIRGLQSRADRRGAVIAQLERNRQGVKNAIKALHHINYPVNKDLLDARDNLNKSVRDLAISQILDRQLLRQQYALQKALNEGRILPKAEKLGPKVGDVILVTDPDCVNYWAYKTGTKAVLIENCGYGQWRAGFSGMDNPPESFDSSCNGEWFIMESEFEVIGHQG